MRLPATRRRWPLAAAFCFLPCVSCVAHEHIVGLGPTGIGQTTVRQYYIFFGLGRLNEVNAQNIANNLTSYTIETEFSFTDLLLFPLILPLTMSSRTVTVKT